MTKRLKTRRRYFDLIQSTDGCDDTFEIISRTTGCRVAWSAFWEQRLQAHRAAVHMKAALEKASRDNRIVLDIAGLAKEQRQIAIVWILEDVQRVRPDLDDEQAWAVLQRCEAIYECQAEFQSLIQWVAEDMFSSSKKGDGQ